MPLMEEKRWVDCKVAFPCAEIHEINVAEVLSATQFLWVPPGDFCLPISVYKNKKRQIIKVTSIQASVSMLLRRK